MVNQMLMSVLNWMSSVNQMDKEATEQEQAEQTSKEVSNESESNGEN